MKILITLSIVFAVSCSSVNKQSTVLLTPNLPQEPATPYAPSDELILKDDFDFTTPESLSSGDVSDDIDLLKFAFEKAYGGRNYVPKEQMENLLTELDKIRSNPPKTSIELCAQIDDALTLISDGHLKANLERNSCGTKRQAQKRSGSVGKNLHTKLRPSWAIKNIQVKRKKVPVISITSLPNEDDPALKGLFSTLRKSMRRSQALVIDLRGNDGGDDTVGNLLANYLYGEDPPTPLSYIIKSQTPETLALFVTSYKNKILLNRKDNTEVPDYLVRRLYDTQRRYAQAKRGELAVEHKASALSGPPFNERKGYRKPIYVLIDAECASSCESILEALEAHPYVVTVGENTAGFIHFGNTGLVVLPESKISIQMATDFWVYKDGRYVEGVGYAAKVSVPKGQDALEVVKTLLLKKI
jgi:hypothetical protein